MKNNENTRVVIHLFEYEWNSRQDRKNLNFSLLLQTFQKLQSCDVLVHSRVLSLGKSTWQLRQTQAEVFALPPRWWCCFRRRCCCRRRRRRHDYHSFRGCNRNDADPSGCAV